MHLTFVVHLKCVSGSVPFLVSEIANMKIVNCICCHCDNGNQPAIFSAEYKIFFYLIRIERLTITYFNSLENVYYVSD